MVVVYKVNKKLFKLAAFLSHNLPLFSTMERERERAGED